jgi:YidC/Oxa1 family membrane protein insertase
MAWSSPAWSQTRIVTDTLELGFSADGSLESASACFPSRDSLQAKCETFGTRGVVSHPGRPEGSSDDWREQSTRDDTRVELLFENTSGASVKWKVPLNGYLLELEAENAGTIGIYSDEEFRPRAAAGFGAWLEQTRYLGMSDGVVSQLGLDDEETTRLAATEWIGYRKRFWALLARRSGGLEGQVQTGAETLDAGIVFDPGAESVESFSIYLGPVESEALGSADPALVGILYAGLWFWLRWICFGLFYILSWINLAIPSWGLAIVVLSVTVNILMRPLSRFADHLQQQVHATEARLAPELQRIKKEHKGEEQASKILALYKTERVHPLYSLKSMMGVAVVIPVFIGAFDMLAENIHLLDASFLWIADLSRSDALMNLPFGLPFFGSELNLLPFLMTGLSIVASAMHNPPALNAELRKKQLRNMLLMAIGFFALFYTFPAGMVLYWTTNNLISVIKSLWARRDNQGLQQS